MELQPNTYFFPSMIIYVTVEYNNNALSGMGNPADEMPTGSEIAGAPLTFARGVKQA